ncbi:MAG: thioesterase family protein [Brasilonema octagenarum HA4186-MV1]|jgi:1,4-dihydroxy-2-naphthoyl-CoA hydrolase|uniref:1,4-dihydroxy-2-naphthoyl-CoA hydrolase n=2 Tax=Brasilonema TaxID=383614 RepID=A0A856MKM7_9CYAN|nr:MULTISPECIES: thioesterase family protein [Brasilonema]MBW4625605.1 thioesterase family protein [Brasilonema octagenarum HA4186-MV1]NMF65133.1 1,4-dihydroxy-2-naphthoyl-CoA hydrolase [Brasilonema octagenarum UFV-OR1]QDL11248.1 1,4-dihydroxy-2-naphthoyl-CoA hydrolase [Brasilonema sennae CENA114]QDL17593.1 1,4-dihydroxy-2-naphthoyl-CoA hydrolase [Brasilonema octagenarum UFV-E1]
MAFIYNRTIRFQDTDAAGVVYFANLLSICHEAYEESLVISGINLKDFFTNPSVAFPIVHANVDFFRPLYCGDNLVIRLMPQQLSVDKFEVASEVIVGEVIAGKAVTRHVCIETSSRTKTELPENMKEWLEMNKRGAESAERRKSREVI